MSNWCVCLRSCSHVKASHCAVRPRVQRGSKGLNPAPSLVLLDLMLPDMHGKEVFRRLRERMPELPVIMLTAKGDPLDRVIGLELGADDYVPKPFDPRELIARVRTVLRRSRAGVDARTHNGDVAAIRQARARHQRAHVNGGLRRGAADQH